MKLIWHINLGFITSSNKLITFFPPYRAAVAWSVIDSVSVFVRWRGYIGHLVNFCERLYSTEVKWDWNRSRWFTRGHACGAVSDVIQVWCEETRSPVFISERMMHVWVFWVLESNGSESIFPRLRLKEYTLKGKWRTHSFADGGISHRLWCLGYITFTLLVKITIQRATFKIWLKWNLKVHEGEISLLHQSCYAFFSPSIYKKLITC